MEWVKGHNGETGNGESDRLATKGAEKETLDDLPLNIPLDYNLQGAKLASMTQALAYRGICGRNNPLPRLTTMGNLEATKIAIRNFTLSHETESSIWKGMRKKSIRPRVQQFLYKTMHGTYKIGNFWSNIPGYQHWGQCNDCQTTEDMNHILVTCTTEPVNIIWTLARDTWPHAPELWPDISLGLILGCGNLSFPEEDEPSDDEDDDSQQKRYDRKGQERLLQILISESAHLIWVLRCDRVINDNPHTPEEIKSRWLKAINSRLTDDKIIATKTQRGKVTRKLVESTWHKALQNTRQSPITGSISERF